MARKFIFSIRSLFEGKGTKEAKDGLNQVGEEARKAGSKTEGAGRKISGFFSKVAADAKKTLAEVKAFGTGFRKVMKSAGDVASKAFSAARTAGLGFVAAGALAVKEATAFSVAMAKVNTMVKTGDIKAYAADVLKLSENLGLGTDTLSNGLYQALSAGIPENNAISFLAEAGKAAVGGATDVATAVDAMTTAINAWKLGSDQAGKVNDALFKTVANGKTTYEELARSLAVVAPQAAATGVSFEEVLAATASLTKQGTPTSVAMTQIRASLIALNDQLGDGWAKTMTMQEGMAELAKRAGGSQNQLREMTGSVEALSGILALTGENAESAAADLKDVQESAGAAGAAFEKMDTIRHWPKLWESIHAVVVSFGAVLDRNLAPLVERITEKIQSWRNNGDLFEILDQKLAVLSDTVLGLWDAIESGRGREVVSALGELLVAYAKKGAEVSIDLIAKAMPLLGRALGEAAKKGFNDWSANLARNEVARERLTARGEISGVNTDLPVYFANKQQQALIEQEANRLKAFEDRESGDRLSQSIGLDADAEIAMAKETLKKIAGVSTEAGQTINQAAAEMELVWRKGEETIEEFIERERRWAEDLGLASEEAATAAEAAAEKTREVGDKAKQGIETAATTMETAAKDAEGKIGGAITKMGTGVEAVAQSTVSGLNNQAAAIDRMGQAVERGFQNTLARIEAVERQAREAAQLAAITQDQVANLRG